MIKGIYIYSASLKGYKKDYLIKVNKVIRSKTYYIHLTRLIIMTEIEVRTMKIGGSLGVVIPRELIEREGEY